MHQMCPVKEVGLKSTTQHKKSSERLSQNSYNSSQAGNVFKILTVVAATDKTAKSGLKA